LIGSAVPPAGLVAAGVIPGSTNGGQSRFSATVPSMLSVHARAAQIAAKSRLPPAYGVHLLDLQAGPAIPAGELPIDSNQREGIPARL
jgi:hypothetical protein